MQLSPGTSLVTLDQKKSRSRRAGSAWTRSGCLTCKKRRKGCDKAKPSCNNCIKVGRVCEGYGSLWAEPLGPSAQVFNTTDGATCRQMSVSPSPQLQPSALQSTFDVQTELYSASESGASDWVAPSALKAQLVDGGSAQAHRCEQNDFKQVEPPCNELILARPSCSYISHLSAHEFRYLQYHVEHSSRLLTNLDTDDNPLRSLLIPRAIFSPILMKALCAISALHLANWSQGVDAQTASAEFYGRALAGLRKEIAECRADKLSDDAMLAIGLMCKYEIVRGSVKQWVVHLNALQRLIASRGGLASMGRDAAVYLRGLYLYAYNISRISNFKRITTSESLTADTDLGTPRLDIYMGYAEDILKICAGIAELPSLVREDSSLRLAIISFNDFLVTWSHTKIPYIIPQGLTPDSLSRLQLVAECFRDAATIYLHSVLERMGTSSTVYSGAENDIFESNPYYTDWVHLISPKSVAVHRCISRIQSFHLDDHPEYSALTFPLFIVGSESDVPEHRDLVARSLSKLEVDFGIGNVKRAKEVLNILWTRRDSTLDRDGVEGLLTRRVHWLDVLEELQWELILA